jgi:hypothetical protein
MTGSGRREAGMSAGQGRFRVFCVLATIVGVVAAFFVLSATKSSAVNEARGQLSSSAQSFPLWSQLPTKSFAVLGEGVIRSRRWGVYLFRGFGSNGGKRPCIEIVTLRQLPGGLSVGNGGPECGAIAPPATMPLAGQSAFGSVGASVVAVVAGAPVSNLRINLDPGPPRAFATRLLNPRQARRAHVRQVRYVAVALGTAGCIEEIQGLDVSGESIFQTPNRGCSS